MRIVFMGTPDFAVPSLRKLLDAGHEIAGVFCQPDKPQGRGHKLVPPPVKVLAQEQGLPVFQPKGLRNAEAQEQLRALKPELIVVAAYGKILPLEVLELPPHGCINVHGSLLPKYRGAGPIQWSLLNGETVTGITTMRMAEGIDTGDMLLKAEIPIGENETAGELFDRLAQLGGEVLLQTLEELKAGRLNPVKQEESEATYAPMLSKELSMLDFSRAAQELHNQVRGLSPWPCAETLLQGRRLKVYRSEIVSLTGGGVPGTLLDAGDFVVQCGEGQIRLTEVQFEGSRRMPGGDFLRGKRLSAGEVLG